MHKFSEEEKEFIIKNNKGKYADQLADMFNKKFNSNITKEQIKSFRGRYHLNSGLTGRFEKGNVSFNKGKKWDDYLSKESQEKCKKTTYKKGNTPHNHRFLYHERINKDGYTEIKIEEPNKWQLKHRYLYEKKYGEIPEGYNVIFLDGNRKNFDLSNLKLVSKAEDLIMNNNKLFTTNKELTESGVLIAKIVNKRNKIKKEKK